MTLSAGVCMYVFVRVFHVPDRGGVTRRGQESWGKDRRAGTKVGEKAEPVNGSIPLVKISAGKKVSTFSLQGFWGDVFLDLAPLKGFTSV